MVVIAFLVALSPVFAQEESMDYSYGTVVKVKASTNEIVVSEYDYDAGEEIEVTYAVDANVNMENVSSIAAIAPGAYVDIEYLSQGSKKIAKSISVYPQEVGE